ncbi:hypothetical protein WDW86_11470 [Bdellovibrionota bacterium FG-2]
MKTRNLLIVLTLVSTGLGGCRPSKPSSVIPSDWYNLPNTENSETPSAASKGLTNNLKENFDLHAQILAEATQDGAAAASSVEDQVPWHLSAVQMRLGLTADGLLGPLLFAGTAAVQTVWMPTQGEGKINSTDSNLTLKGNPRSANLDRQLEPMIQSALSSKLIRNETKFRKNVLRIGERFKAVAARLYDLHSVKSKWVAQKFRLKMGFDASGDVLPFGALGATISLRFDWDKASTDTDPAVQVPAPSLDPLSENLGQFVTAVAHDLNAIQPAIDEVQTSGFSLGGIRIGLAITGSGEVGIAKALTSVAGSIEFERTNSLQAFAINLNSSLPKFNPIMPNFIKAQTVSADNSDKDDNAPILMIDDAPAAHTFDTARRLGIQFNVIASNSQTTPDKVVYKIDRSRLRKGLSKAVRIGAFFAKSAAQAKVGKWKISEISTEYDASISGALGLVTASGQGIVELVFSNNSF